MEWPVWPFQTTQVLAGMVNLLDHYRHSVVTRADFARLLRQYVELHCQGDRLDLEEDYDPATGRPIVGLARSHHYFHSGFVDLVVTGIAGIRPRADDVLEVHPLSPSRGPGALGWFRVEGVRYHGHDVSMRWDADGRHYRAGRGLGVLADGREVASAPTLRRITVPLARVLADPIVRPIDRAMQLVRGGLPRPSASSNADAEALHDAVDGRTWFFPEAPNGWTSAGGHDEWFALDLGTPIALERAELAFLADDKGLAAPAEVVAERWTSGRWAEIARARPVANGITDLRWPAIRTGRMRVRMTRRNPAQRFRLVEFKLF